MSEIPIPLVHRRLSTHTSLSQMSRSIYALLPTPISAAMCHESRLPFSSTVHWPLLARTCSPISSTSWSAGAPHMDTQLRRTHRVQQRWGIAVAAMWDNAQ
jgi:hypothetical protein